MYSGQINGGDMWKVIMDAENREIFITFVKEYRFALILDAISLLLIVACAIMGCY